MFPLEYKIMGDRRETPQVEMEYTLGQFSYEKPVIGYIEGMTQYTNPLFYFGCTIYNITYERSEGWINHYSKEYKSITSMIDSISEEEMNTGLSKTLPGDCDYQEMDSIKLLLHMNLYLFNWDLDFTFEKRPSILAHFFRTYWVILLAVGFVSITVTVTIIKKKRF